MHPMSLGVAIMELPLPSFCATLPLVTGSFAARSRLSASICSNGKGAGSELLTKPCLHLLASQGMLIWHVQTSRPQNHHDSVWHEGQDNDLGADLGCCLVAWVAGRFCTGSIALSLPQPVSGLVNQAHLHTQPAMSTVRHTCT